MPHTLTPFGKVTRKLRVERGELLKDMARHLGVSPSYLSFVERGIRNVPAHWVVRLAEHYQLSPDQMTVIEHARSVSSIPNRIDVSHLTIEDKQLVQQLVKQLPFCGKKQEEWKAWFTHESIK